MEAAILGVRGRSCRERRRKQVGFSRSMAMADVKCDQSLPRKNNMVFAQKYRMKTNVGIDLDYYIQPMEVGGTPKDATHAWICDDGRPSGFGFKCKDMDAWYTLRDLCIVKMGSVSRFELAKDRLWGDYGKVFSDDCMQSGSWRELNSRDGASLHITMYRDKVPTKDADVTLHLDEISIATDRDGLFANYDWSRVPAHIMIELWHWKGVAAPGREDGMRDYLRNNWLVVRDELVKLPDAAQKAAAALKPYAPTGALLLPHR